MSTDDIFAEENKYTLVDNKAVEEACKKLGFDSPLLSQSDVCKVLRISLNTLKKLPLRKFIITPGGLANHGRDQHRMKAGGIVRYCASDLVKFLHSVEIK